MPNNLLEMSVGGTIGGVTRKPAQAAACILPLSNQISDSDQFEHVKSLRQSSTRSVERVLCGRQGREKRILSTKV